MDEHNIFKASNKSKVAIRSIKGKTVQQAIEELLDALNWCSFIKSGLKVVIKPNFNTADPAKIESANTSPLLIEGVCSILKTRTKNITIVEANGYRHSAEKTFQVMGIYEIAKRIGVNVVNLSKQPCRNVGNPLLGPLPDILLDADVFITMPVIKTHALTYFTGALKNQWGCIPRHDRIALHEYLDELIVELNRMLNPQLCIMDGIIGVEGRGPTNGKPRRLDIILGSTDPVALDATAMRLVGLDPTKARHVVMAYEAGLGKFHEDEITIDSDVQPNWAPFEPAQLDWAIYWMNRLSKYNWFRKYILEVNAIFYPTKRVVNILRLIGVVR
jgi:uncharacterized protein (DUF362 family)